jgi:DNA-directed RNA polymerase specialized sigma subunit
MNPRTGLSGTRDFLERFLDDYNELMAATLGGPPEPSAPIYEVKAKDGTKRYVGRAAQIMNGSSEFEELWCMRVDIGNAIKQLDVRSRIVLGRRYLLGEEYHEIAEFLGVSENWVKKVRSSALRSITNTLDGVVD